MIDGEDEDQFLFEPSQVLVNDNVIEAIIRFFDVDKFTAPAENPNL